MKKHLLIFFSLCLCFFFQNSIFPQMGLFDISPNLLVVLTVSIGLMDGFGSGILTGLICGALWDVFAGDGGIGFYILFFSFAGGAAAYFHKDLNHDLIVFPVLMCGLADLCFGLYIYVFRFLIRGRLEPVIYFKKIIVPELLVTVLAALILYPILYRLYVRCSDDQKRRTSDFA